MSSHPPISQSQTSSVMEHAGTAKSRVSDAQNIHANVGRIFRGPSRGKFRGKTPQIPAFALTTKDWNKRSAAALRAHMKAEGLSVKEMADLIGCNDRTFENYIQEKTSPAGTNFLRCLAVCPEFEAEVTYVSALQRDLDPIADRRAMELVVAAQRYMDARAAADDIERAPVTGEQSSKVADGAEAELSAAVGDLFAGEPR